VKAEALLALIDLVVVVDLAVGRTQLETSIEVAESAEGLIGLERSLCQDEEVRLSGAGVVAVHASGVAKSCRDPISQMRDLGVVAVGRAGNRKDEKEFHCWESSRHLAPR
jgi:hypothetical protein